MRSDLRRFAALCLVVAVGAAAAPAVASASSQQTLETGLLADGVAVDSAGDVFATDFSGNRVVELSAGGTQTTLPFTGLNHPIGVAVDQLGDVFVADSGNNRVLELPALPRRRCCRSPGLARQPGLPSSEIRSSQAPASCTWPMPATTGSSARWSGSPGRPCCP